MKKSLLVIAVVAFAACAGASQASDGPHKSKDFAPAPAAAVPEPGTWALMLVGFAGLGLAMRNRRALTA